MSKDIFSKIIKNYNNELERILEKKAFSENVKNLLLSMLYKIENSYDDYKKVKVNVCSKNNFVEEILNIIETYCNRIDIIKPMSQEGQKLYEKNINCIVDKQNGEIKTFQNEKSLLEALINLKQKEIEIPSEYDLYKESIVELLLNGNKINNIELITDFNGWSWDVTSHNNLNDVYNKIYQMLIILLGNKELDKWINDREIKEEYIPSNVILSSKYNENFGITKKEFQLEKQDEIKKIINKFEDLYGKELCEKFFGELIKICILQCTKLDKQYEEKIKTEINSKKQELEKMMNNKMFIESLTLEKKEITRKIKKIDELISDEKILKEEYKKRNEKLENKDKIFSVSHLKLMLEKERNNNLEEIKKINKKMEPQEYVKIKQELEEKINFYEDINLDDKTKKNILRLETKLEKIFLKCFELKIENTDENKEIENLIYELRYYNLMLPQVIKTTKNIETKLINKACERKVLTKFSQNENTNYMILKELFYSKIIDLDTIVYILKYSKGVLTINIYDDKIHEETRQIEITEKTELNVKLNKKIKIWQ